MMEINRITENSFVVKRDFTIHGISKEISVPFEVPSQEGNTLGIKIETLINRIDDGLGKDFKHTSIPNFLSADSTAKF